MTVSMLIQAKHAPIKWVHYQENTHSHTHVHTYHLALLFLCSIFPGNKYKQCKINSVCKNSKTAMLSNVHIMLS